MSWQTKVARSFITSSDWVCAQCGQPLKFDQKLRYVSFAASMLIFIFVANMVDAFEDKPTLFMTLLASLIIGYGLLDTVVSRES